MDSLSDILISSFTLILILLVPGSVWYRFAADEEPFRPGRCVACGLLVLLVTGLLLGLGGVFIRGNLLVLCFIFSLPVIGGKILRRLFVPVLVMTLLLTAVRMLPGQSQWLAGGWDPGTYLNSGIQLARHQEFDVNLGAKPPRPPNAVAPTTVERPPVLVGQSVPRAFLMVEREYQEVFPGFPYLNESDRASPSTHTYFFKLQCVWVGMLYHVGGVEMAAQAGLIAGILGLIIWSSLLLRLWGRIAAGVGTGLFLLHPIWIYHLDLPLPELLQITLMGCLLLFTEENDRAETKNRPWMLPLILCLMTLNRITFFLFGSWWLAFYAATHEIKEGKKDWTLLLGILGLSIGLTIDLIGSPYAMRLQHVLPQMIQAGCGGWIIAGCICVARSKGRLSSRMALLLPTAVLILAGAKMGGLPGNEAWLSELWIRLRAFIDFSGRVYVLVFVVCLLPFMLRAWRKPTMSSAFALWLMGAAWLWWNYPHSADLYPWATRRMLLFAVPLAVFVVAWGSSMAWKRASKHLPSSGRSMALALTTVFLILQVPNAVRAWRPQEFSGASAQLKLVAEQLPKDGLIISDHFRWGVPLWTLHNRFMLNGDNFRIADEAYQKKALNWLRRQQKDGTPIYLLTSTSIGTAQLGDLPGKKNLLWQSEPFHYQQLHHHSKLRRFVMEDVEKEFRVYRWDLE